MNRKILAIGILGLLLITGFAGVSTATNNVRTTEVEAQGSFEAEMGRRGNNKPLVYLNGNYKSRGRFIVVGGTAKAGDKVGRFRGAFRGNNFFIRTSVGNRVLTIFGRCRFDEEHHSFTGIWIGRGIPVRGWITGVFTPAY